MNYFFVKRIYESEFGGASYAEYEVIRGEAPPEYGPILRGDDPSQGWESQSVYPLGDFQSWEELCEHELFKDYPSTHNQFHLAHQRGWGSVSV